MEKPKKRYPYEPMYFWNDVENYICKKYNRDLRDWANKLSSQYDAHKPYLDFWHLILEHIGCKGNGTCFYLSRARMGDDAEEDWVKEIFDILEAEGFLDNSLDEGELAGEFFVSW